MRLATAGRVLCVLMLLAPALLLAGTTGKIAGVVTDAATGEGLPGVSVRLEGSSLGAATDIEGRYTILNVSPGVHDVTSSYVGYKRTTVRGVRVSVDHHQARHEAGQGGHRARRHRGSGGAHPALRRT